SNILSQMGERALSMYHVLCNAFIFQPVLTRIPKCARTVNCTISATWPNSSDGRCLLMSQLVVQVIDISNFCEPYITSSEFPHYSSHSLMIGTHFIC
ncbi:MAG TPA: hypothetical protein VGO47_15255, partial [Chlamydiales bacterium]|nr:hypothetical protein [Chlamydiales bacterium]